MSNDNWDSLLINLIASGLFKAGEELFLFARGLVSERQRRRIVRVRNARRKELAYIRSIVERYAISGNVAPLRQIEINYVRNPAAYKVLEVYDAKQHGYETVIGFYVIHKIKRAFVSKMIQGKSNILDLQDADVHKKPSASSGYYISMAYAETRMARGPLMEAINSCIYYGNYAGGDQFVITRPGPLEAVAFCKKYGFTSVNGGEVTPHEICYRKLPTSDSEDAKKALMRLSKYRLHF